MRDDLPRFAMRLLSLRLPDEWRDYVEGDLEEEFRARARVSVPAARRWFWRQTLRCLAAPPPRSLERRSDETCNPRRDPFMRTILFDTRHAMRVFRSAPSFALAVVAAKCSSATCGRRS